MKRLAAFALAGAMVIGTCTTAFAYDTYQGYTEVQDVNVPANIVTATAHRAAAPLIDMLGANATSGFGMLNGSAPATLSDANNSLGIQIWGTNKNQVRDPYYANYYYNFYASANSLTPAATALINDDRSGSPIQADQQGTSLSTRPDIVIGVSSTANDVTDDTGYDEQLEDINDGLSENDENYYNPKLVKYNPTTLDTMVQTVNAAATAIDSVSGKTTRYAVVPYNLSASTIADKYEQYVQGIQGYIVKYKTKKKVAIVKSYDADSNTFTIVGQGASSTTSSDRIVEYTSKICTNVTSNSTESVAASVLNGADYIISENATADAYLTSAYGVTKADANIILSTERPDTLYGITMNSVENAMGLAYFAAYMYGNNSDGSDPLNCWNLMRYFYSVFWHVNDVELNGDQTDLLYKAMENTLNVIPVINTPYSQTVIETALAEGETYYDQNLVNASSN